MTLWTNLKDKRGVPDFEKGEVMPVKHQMWFWRDRDQPGIAAQYQKKTQGFGKMNSLERRKRGEKKWKKTEAHLTVNTKV